MKFTSFLVGLALTTASIGAAAMCSSPAVGQTDDFRAQADALLNAANPEDGPGAAVIVTREGRVLYSGSRGLAELETGRPITTDTMLPMGSITKQFTAVVILALVEEGLISLDDPISRFFPDWPEPSARATVRQLLNHSSGVQDVTKIPGWVAQNGTRVFTTGELLDLHRELPPRAEPGNAWEYNNSGYLLLGAIVEQVTGTTWRQAVIDRIVNPLGLSGIGFVSDPTSQSARSYGIADGRLQPISFPPASVFHAGGGLTGSVDDMARWAHALHNGHILSAAMYQEMIQPARLEDGSRRPYGFGLRLQEIRGRLALVHGGAGFGTDTDSVYIPSEDLFVAVFANTDSLPTDASTLTRRLAALALGEPIPEFTRADIDISTVEPLFGSYASDQGPDFRFFAQGDQLYLGREGSQREVFSAGEDRFFFGPDVLMWFRIVRRSDGEHVMELYPHDTASSERAVRTGPVPPEFTVSREVLQGYTGVYSTEIWPVTVTLGEDGRLIIAFSDQSFPIRPVSDTEFMIDGTPMRVVFHVDNGEVNSLTMYRGARELQGTRN